MSGLTYTGRIAAILTIALAMILVLPGCGGRRAEQARQMGDVHLQNRNFSEAQAKYQEALDMDPESALAQLGIAHVARMRGESENAIAEYEKAIALDPSVTEAYVQAARLHLTLGAPEEAASLAERLTEIDERVGTMLRASIHRAQGEIDEAIALLEKVRDESGDANARVDLAQAYMQRGDAEAAEAELRAAIESNPDELRARLMLIRVYRAQGRLADMEAELEESIAREEEAGSGREHALKLELAQVILGQGRVDEALALAEGLAAETPDQPWVQFVYANCLNAAGREAEAIQAMQKAVTGLPDEPDVAEALAALQRGDAPAAQPTQVATTTPTASTPGTTAPSQQPAIGLDTSDWRLLWNSASLQQLVHNRDRFTDDDPLLNETIAVAAMFTGRDDITKEYLPKLDPDSHLVKLYDRIAARDAESAIKIVDNWQEVETDRAVISQNTRGFVYATIGLRAKALEIFVRALNAYPENGVALYNIATMYNTAGMPNFAARALSKLLEQSPNALEVRVLLYRTQRRANLDDESLATAEITYSLFPNEEETIVNLGNAYLDRGDVDLAKKVFDRGLEVLEDKPSFLGTYALALMQLGNLDGGVEILEKTEFEGNDAVRAAELIAFRHALNGRHDEALTTINAVNDGELSQGGVYVLTAAQLATGKKAEAAASLSKGAERIDRLRRTAQLLLVALGEDDAELSESTASLVAAIKGNDEAAATYALALGAISFQVFRPAYDLLEKLEAQAGQHPPLATLMLAALSAPTAYADRIDRAEAIVSRYDGSYVYPGLAGVYAGADNQEGQREALQRGIAEFPDDINLWRAVALESSVANDIPRAIEAYERVIELGDTSGAIYNNYAYYLLRSDGDEAKALEIAKQAVEKLESDPNAIHTLGLALLENGAVDEAVQQLSLAAQMRPGDPVTLFDLGRGLIEANREDEGRSLIQRAISNADAIGIEFDRREEAQAILER